MRGELGQLEHIIHLNPMMKIAAKFRRSINQHLNSCYWAIAKNAKPIQEKPNPRRKQIVVETGKSISLDDLTPDKDDASERDSEEESDSDESQSEGPIINDLSDQ